MLQSLLSKLTGSDFDLNGAEFAEKMRNDDDAVLLDVRTDMEYRQGHIPNAELLDIMSPNFRNSIDNLDRSKSYYLYCRSGNRSGQACRMMQKMGFERVYNLSRGIFGWNEKLVTD